MYRFDKVGMPYRFMTEGVGLSTAMQKVFRV
jgi:hypothetical protein